MLAGLLFAIQDAEDRPDRLAATLPFGGVTLIEYQARLLIAAGVSQIIVVVARLTPELLGAIARIGRRGVAIDTIRSAAEAMETLHPLARVLMLGDGLVTTDPIVRMMAREGDDALLVLAQSDAGARYERVGGQMAWAGIARLDPKRIAEVAALPRDYDLESTLLRLAAQAQATQVMLPAQALRQGHGIERQARTLEQRGRAMMASRVASRRGWFDRYLLAPIAKHVLPLLVEKAISTLAVAAVGIGIGGIGLIAIWFGVAGGGLAMALVACLVFGIGTTLADLRDEPGLAHGQGLAIGGIGALSVLTLALLALRGGSGVALAVALALIVAAALGERAVPDRDRTGWWGNAPAYLLMVAVGTIAGFPLVGLSVAALYATGTLTAIIERLRREP